MIKLVLETTVKFSRPWPRMGTHDIPDEQVMEEGRMIGSGGAGNRDGGRTHT